MSPRLGKILFNKPCSQRWCTSESESLSNMELSIDQALQQAVEAHKAGKLQDAEALYRAILQAQPNHPDANHNLGVLAVSLNKSELAVPLFKTALEANPNQGQFWLSYIDALIKEKQFDNARNLLEQGKKAGLAGEKVDALEAHLATSLLVQNPESLLPNQKNLNQARSPSQAEVNALLENYQKGQYDLAENLAKDLIQKYPDHLFSWKVLSAVFKQTGRLQDSLTANQRAVEISPNDAEAHSNLGNTLKVLGRLEEAETSYKKAIAIKPDLAEAHSNLGITLQKLGRLEDAETSYKKAIAIKPDYAEAHSNLGITLQKLGRLEDAETSYKKAIAIKPKYAEAHSSLGNTLRELGRLEDAETSYKKAIAIKPDYAEAHSNLGNTLKELGRLEDAETSYKKAIAIKPDLAEAHSNLGNTLQKLGRQEDAETSYKKAIAIKPDLADAHSNLGITLQKLGRLEDAETSYKKAIAIKPDFAEAHVNLGNTLKELGKLEDAEMSYKKAIAIKPDYADAHYNFGTSLHELGRLEDAETSYKKAIAIKPDYAQAHSNLGNILQELGRLEDAVRSYEKAIAIKPDLELAHSNLGSTMHELGRLEDAETSYNKAIAIKPDCAEAHSNLGNTLKALGRVAEAEASFAEAVKLKPDYIKARNEMLTCLYLMDKKLEFFAELDYSIKQDIANSVIGSLTCRSALKYGDEYPNIFCSAPLEHVLHVDLKSRYNFEEIFVLNAKAVLSDNNRSHKKQDLLSNGYQTSGNLFDIGNSLTDQIQKAIRLEIERYRINFESSQEGLIIKWSTEYSLYGWLISMKSGGELHPHIHESGWLSGSIYINVPPKLKIDSGNLVVALGKDSDTTNSCLNFKKVIDVVTGSMVLFPASLMHHTIPFESDEERIVLAFDVILK
jgi:tetratricopeptide (TPR) repeat protein